jgi:hypothetical protein
LAGLRSLRYCIFSSFTLESETQSQVLRGYLS